MEDFQQKNGHIKKPGPDVEDDSGTIVAGVRYLKAECSCFRLQKTAMYKRGWDLKFCQSFAQGFKAYYFLFEADVFSPMALPQPFVQQELFVCQPRQGGGYRRWFGLPGGSVGKEGAAVHEE